MKKELEILYTAEATATGGREGRAFTSDGRLDVDLDVPREMGGPGGPGTNPEQLFMARAHETCPYSRAAHGNIEVTLSAGGILAERQAA